MSQENNGKVSVLSGLVSVLVPCCGQLEYTKLCVPGLLRYSREPVELIFIDIGSLDGTAAYLAGIKTAARVHVEVVRTETDLGIGAAVKEALGRAKGEYVVLLNNDTVVSDSWLNQLIGLAVMRTDIGLVGPMSNYAAPPQLVETVPYRVLPRNEGRIANPSYGGEEGELDVSPVHTFAREWREEQRGKWIEVDRLGGFCLLIKRQVLTKIGLAHKVRQQTVAIGPSANGQGEGEGGCAFLLRGSSNHWEGLIVFSMEAYPQETYPAQRGVRARLRLAAKRKG